MADLDARIGDLQRHVAQLQASQRDQPQAESYTGPTVAGPSEVSATKIPGGISSVANAPVAGSELESMLALVSERMDSIPINGEVQKDVADLKTSIDNLRRQLAQVQTATASQTNGE